MKKYIDADVLYRKVKERTNPYGNPSLDFESGCKVLDMIEAEPTADVQEVKHGEWIDASNKSQVKCSICGARIKYSECFNGNHLYCHKCGARMDGEEK